MTRYQCETCGEVPISGDCPHGCDALPMCDRCGLMRLRGGVCAVCVDVERSAPILCGACSDDLGDPGEWADAVRELAPADRIPCQGCGA